MIDVIIPVYNGHKYLDTALKSVVNQTIKDKLKVYIIDDASEYGYQEFVEKYKDKLDIREITLKKNKKLAGARQKGIEVSTSEFITFLDCDDDLPNNALEIMYNQIRNNPQVNAITGRTNQNGKDIYEFGAMWGKIFRRSFLEKYNIKCKYSYNTEDILFTYKVYFLCDPDEYIELNDIVYNYNQGINEESLVMININVIKTFDGYLHAYKKAYKLAKKYKKQNNMYKMTSKFFYHGIYRIIEKSKKNFRIKLSEKDLTLMINKSRKFYNKYKKQIEYGAFNYFNDNGYIKFIKELES